MAAASPDELGELIVKIDKARSGRLVSMAQAAAVPSAAQGAAGRPVSIGTSRSDR